MGWKVKRRERCALIEVDEVNPLIHRTTFQIGPRHVKHHATKEFVEHAHVESPAFASERDCRVFAQCSNIAVEVYDFYNKLFNPDYENVSVYDERFDVQYLFREQPERWRSADYYNPRIEIIPLKDGVDIKKVFDTDYGPETLEITYTVRAGAFLKHTVVFTNKTAEQKTFRVVMKLAGITSDKVKHRQGEERIAAEKHLITPFIRFGEDDQNLKLSEHLWSLGTADEEPNDVWTDDEWYPTTLKDIVLDVHAKGCKADIIIGNYTLAENEALEIDPASDTWEVSAGSDDCIKRIKNGATEFSTTKTTGYIGYNSATAYKMGCGFRFLNVGIPKDAIIDAATVSFYAYESHADVVIRSIIKGEDTDDAATFSDLANFDARARTSAVVNWDGIGAWVVDTRYTSPEIKTIIQEIVNRGGWSSGNDMVIFWDDWDNRTDNVAAHVRRMDHIEIGSGEYAILSVTWHTAPIAYTVTLTESLGLVDVISKKHGHAFFLVLSEALGLVDTLTGRVGVTWSRFRTLVVRWLHSRV